MLVLAFVLLQLWVAVYATVPTGAPTSQPTMNPTVSFEPTSIPTKRPSFFPTQTPVTYSPTDSPVLRPTSMPSSTPPTSQPTGDPSGQPSGEPTQMPTSPTSMPTTRSPTPAATLYPTRTFNPTGQPTSRPTSVPTAIPISFPTSSPTNTFRPTGQPTGQPTVDSVAPTAVYQTHTIFGAVHLDNPDSGFCQPLAINVTIAFDQAIGFVGQWFIVKTPGVTIGPCKSAANGAAVTELVIQDTTNFKALFYEGTWENYFSDSYIRIELKVAPVTAGFPYQIMIDRINRLKRNCLPKNYWEVQEYRTTTQTYGTIGWLNITNLPDNIYQQCYAYSSKVEFYPKFQKFPTAITLTLALAFKIEPGDTIYLYLPGFTNSGRYLSNIDRTIVSTASGSTSLASIIPSTDFNWTTTWNEGTVENQYSESYATFTMLARTYKYPRDVPRFPDRNGVFNITITRASQLSAFCGQHGNYSGFAIQVQGAAYNIAKTSVTMADGIGPGCKAQNNCNNNGVCNYCTSTCECFNGFGSAQDLTTALVQNFNPDCSSRTCPLGRAVRNGGKDGVSVSTMHRLVECSNNGICHRANGTCSCFAGFGGAACEKMDCPYSGNPSNVCSGRGVCLPQSFLTIKSEALPLSDSTTTKYLDTTDANGTTWDANFGRACVCDSSWPVGLGANQTQQAEYFGAACEYRRCPTGDNPGTSDVDETDCEGKAMTTGGGVGAAGNKCHVDCSGKGTCNYATGVCSCFAGFGGVNCGTRQ